MRITRRIVRADQVRRLFLAAFVLTLTSSGGFSSTSRQKSPNRAQKGEGEVRSLNKQNRVYQSDSNTQTGITDVIPSPSIERVNAGAVEVEQPATDRNQTATPAGKAEPKGGFDPAWAAVIVSLIVLAVTIYYNRKTLKQALHIFELSERPSLSIEAIELRVGPDQRGLVVAQIRNSGKTPAVKANHSVVITCMPPVADALNCCPEPNDPAETETETMTSHAVFAINGVRESHSIVPDNAAQLQQILNGTRWLLV